MASKGRECRTIIACGIRGVGKSVETIRQIFEYVKGNPSKGLPPRRALIFDINNEFSDFWFLGDQQLSIKTLKIADIGKFSVHPITEVRRIHPFMDDGRPMTVQDMNDVLGIILDTYRNGLLLIEDINKYTGDHMTTDVIGTLISTRHKGLDLFIHFQNIGRAGNPKIIANTNFIRLHKTTDSVSRHENKFHEKTEVLLIAEHIVRKRYNEGDKRFFVYVDVINCKIQGKFTDDEIDSAIHEYISDDYKNTVGRLEKAIDNDGKKLHTKSSAIAECKKNLKKEYFETAE